MPRLSPVLDPTDLPEAELRAAILDGELFAFRDGYCPIDEIEGTRHRAMTLARTLPPKVIAERRTAAWVLGLGQAPPSPLEACTDIAVRTRIAPVSGLTVREVVIDPDECLTIEGLRITSPLRTAIDLARTEEAFGAPERELVGGLALLGRFGFEDCVAAIDARRNLPNKHLAIERLAVIEHAL
ncbi:MAG TPA: hypothetical protein VFS93_02065 [Terrimesophilobacter sp.]|nr:hypothetical protein [Terrimesophilobacter sp.]